MLGSGDELSKQVNGLRRWLPPIVGLAIFIAMIFVVRRELTEFEWRDVLANMRALPVATLAAAVFCSMVSYLFLTTFDMAALRYVRKSLPFRRVIMGSVIAYAFGNNIGASWLSGGAVRYRLYSAAHLKAGEIAAVQVFCTLTSALGLALLIGIALLTSPEYAASALHVAQPWPSVVGASLIIGVLAYITWGSVGHDRLQFRGRLLGPPGAALSSTQVVLGALEPCIASLVLWQLLPHDQISFLGFLGVYSLAVVAALLSHVPGGLGVFESVMLIGMPGVSADVMIAALLGYRVLYYWLPFVVGGVIFLIGEARTYRREAERARAG